MRLSSGITPASDSLVAFTMIMKRIVYLLSFSSLPGHDDHPTHAEAVGDHTETRREEGFAERHADLTAIGKGVEEPIGGGGIGCCDRQRKTPEHSLPGTFAVRSHHGRVADTEARVHHFVLGARRHHPGWGWLRAVFVAHEHGHLRAERA